MNVPAVGRKRLVVVGATGMVGGYALRYALDHPVVERATAIRHRRLGHIAFQAGRGPASRLRGLYRARGELSGQAATFSLAGHLFGLGLGHCGLRRVCAPPPPQ